MTDGRRLDKIDEETEEEDSESRESIEKQRVSDENQEDINSERRPRRGIVIVKDEEKRNIQEEVKPSTKKPRRRTCMVCSETIQNIERGVQPCPCEYWVHHQCLVSGLLRYEADHPACRPLGCRFCQTHYNIFPTKNAVVKSMERISVMYDRFCEFCFYGVVLIVVDSTFSVLGMIALDMIYGPEEATELLVTMEVPKAVSICKSIPLISVTINSLPWENKVLPFLRRCSGLPIIGGIFPRADPGVREAKQRRTFIGTVVGGFLLPWNAMIFGAVMFGSVESKLSRFLLGGVTFLVVKGVLQMYYRQKLYARQCCLTVEAFSNEE